MPLSDYTVLGSTLRIDGVGSEISITDSSLPPSSPTNYGAVLFTGTGSYNSTIPGAATLSGPPNSTAAQAEALIERTVLRARLATRSNPTLVGTTLTYKAGVYKYSSSQTYESGTEIILDAENDPNAEFFIIAETQLVFRSVKSITLVNNASTCNVHWVAGTENIRFEGAGTPEDPYPPTIPGIFNAATSITFASPSTIYGRLHAETLILFTGETSVDSACRRFPDPICYVKGTLILTQKGFVPIENIKAGDKVITKGRIYNNKFIKKDADVKFETVIWASKFKVLQLSSSSRPICIKKGALKNGYPLKDLYVSPNHGLLINGKIVRAINIVNGTTIYQDNECTSVEYYHLECERHSAIFANGVLSESYLDLNNRDIFESSVKLNAKKNLPMLSYSKLV